MARMMACNNCGILWRLRDYDGAPEYDMELREIVDRHLQTAIDPRPESHMATLYRISDKEAELIDVESEVQKKLKETQVFIKETRDDMKLQSIKCYDRHMRPKGGCIDWHDESKIIGRKTGVPKDQRQYLCDFCPAAQHYVFKARQAKGMYNG